MCDVEWMMLPLSAETRGGGVGAVRRDMEELLRKRQGVGWADRNVAGRAHQQLVREGWELGRERRHAYLCRGIFGVVECCGGEKTGM